MKENYKNRLILVTLILMLIFYLFNSQYILNNIIDYSKLFLTKLFPVSFIFFIISSLLIDFGIISFLDNVLHIKSTKLYVFTISMISGFPSGAKYTRDLYNKGFISCSDANKLMMFSHFPNPLFIISSLTLVIPNRIITRNILLSIIISNFIIMLFCKIDGNKYNDSNFKKTNFSLSLATGIKSAFEVLCIIYGTSLFFYLISCIILNNFSFSHIYYVLICGVFDLTKGIFSVSLLDNNYLRGIFVLLFICFGSLSIHLQIKSILSDTPINYKYFIFGRIFGTLLAFFTFNLLMLF